MSAAPSRPAPVAADPTVVDADQGGSPPDAGGADIPVPPSMPLRAVAEMVHHATESQTDLVVA